MLDQPHQFGPGDIPHLAVADGWQDGAVEVTLCLLWSAELADGYLVNILVRQVGNGRVADVGLRQVLRRPLSRFLEPECVFLRVNTYC